MNISSGGAILVAACVGTAFALWLRRKGHYDMQTHTARLHEWENEGGNLAPSPQQPAVDLKARQESS